MSSSNHHHDHPEDEDFEHDMLDQDEVGEVLEGEDGDGDVPMGSDDEGEDLFLQNDSIAYFDGHKDSVFAIAQHPLFPNLIATGGSEGDSDDAPGKGYVIDTAAAVSRPVLPPSYNSDPEPTPQNPELNPIFAIDGHTDSINALAFTLPRGDFLVSGGMDGRLRVYAVAASQTPTGVTTAQFKFLAESQETEEVNWLLPCPSPEHPNTIAFGANDGSVWVLTLDASDPSNPIQIVQSYFLHTGPCTAGSWTRDGQLLATVSEDASLHVFDVWGAAAARSLVTDNGQTVVSLTEADQRFAVEGGLYSVAISPGGGLVAAGGAGGAIRIVGLPRLAQAQGQNPRAAAAATAQAGAILAAINVQGDSVESLAFSPNPSTPCSPPGQSTAASPFSTRALLRRAPASQGVHDGESVVRVEFVKAASGAAAGWLLTSCGLDGAVRRWDLRGATAGAQASAGGPASSGLVKEWRGHREVVRGWCVGICAGGDGERIVTAGMTGWCWFSRLECVM
ncbi:60S ribosomal subunit assembly or modification protein [Collariella sp. IMI 366227]|nr:60S ribosomal subunit assembly or modification protein [Collariella sp. IMI 366227]